MKDEEKKIFAKMIIIMFLIGIIISLFNNLAGGSFLFGGAVMSFLYGYYFKSIIRKK